MDDTRLAQLEQSIAQLNKTMASFGQSQDKIVAALLGSYENNQVGLIEQTRNIRKDLDEIVAKTEEHGKQIEEVIEFKRDTKKIVIGIGFIIPVLFESLKLIFTFLWEAIKIK